MHFVLYCLDKRSAAQVRLDNRPAHVEFLHSWGDAISLAGPLLADDGEGMIGSMIVLEVDSRSEVERFINEDPYGVAGLFESVTVHPYKQVIKSSS